MDTDYGPYSELRTVDASIGRDLGDFSEQSLGRDAVPIYGPAVWAIDQIMVHDSDRRLHLKFMKS